MSKRRRITALIATVLTLSACTGTPPKATGPLEEVFTYANNLEIMTSWDPATSYSNEGIAMSNMYEQLTRYDSVKRAVTPLLADSWSASLDGTTWTFKLHPGVKFSTGKPADAAAAKAAFERTIKLAGGAAYEWDSVKSIDAPDPTTLVFTLKYAAPLDLISSSGFGAYVYDTTAAAGGDLTKWFESGNAAGTGPYVVDTWHKGQENELTLKANTSYWRGWSGDHYTSAVFRVVPEETTAAQLLQSGQVSFVPRVSPSLFGSLSKSPGVRTSEQPSFQNALAMLNTASGPLTDVRLRKAVSLTIDYGGIVSALKGAMVRAQGVIPDGLMGFTKDVGQTTDVAAARQLLTEAGYGPGGRPLTLTLTYVSGDPELETIVTLMKSNLSAVGITLNAKSLAWETQWNMGKSQDKSQRQDIFLFYWYPDYADPFSWFANLYRATEPVQFNLSYVDDPELNATIDGLQALTATDPTKATQQYVDLQKHISDEAWSPVLGVQNFQRAYASSVSGYVDNPSYSNVVFVHDLTPVQ